MYKIQGARPRILNTLGDKWLQADFSLRARAARRPGVSLSPVCFFPTTSCRQLSSVPNIYKQPERRERRHRQSRQAGPIRPKKATDPPLAPLPIIHILFLSHPRDHIRPRHTCQKWHLPLAIALCILNTTVIIFTHAVHLVCVVSRGLFEL